MNNKYIAVIFNLPIEKPFWYRVPPEFKNEVKIGQRVLAPFGKREMVGFIVEQSEKKPRGRLKEIIRVFDKFPPLDNNLFSLAKWMSEYYCCSLGQALHSLFPFPYPYLEDLPPEIGLSDGKDEDKENIYLVQPGDKKFELVSSFIADNRKLEKQAIILVPEINLITGFEEKIKKIEKRTISFHSKLSIKERYKRWLMMKKAEVNVAIGTRSVIFAPFPKLGLIVVDQEESTDYKQKETPKYNVRQIAIKRGKMEKFSVFLISDAPSLESWYQAKKKVYKSFNFSRRRKGSFFEVVDLKKEKKKDRIFSRLLQDKIKDALEKKLSVMLFVSRRGYASFLLCSDCGEVIRCPNCNIGLSFHLKREMICHYCGFRTVAPSVCPFCGGRNLKKIGWGTQRVENEVKKRFPGARVKRFDLDIFKSSTYLIPDYIKKREVDILVGTQLLIKEDILSLVGVVGVMLVDVLLNLPDFRASERTFQLLTRIRKGSRGKNSVIVQTYNPTHYVLNAKSNEDFYSRELKIRKQLGYPPYQRWVRILIEGKRKDQVKDKSEEILNKIKKEGFNFLGPSPCPLSKIKGSYRYHIILRDTKGKNMQEFIKEINPLARRSSIKIGIDVDPLSTM